HHPRQRIPEANLLMPSKRGTSSNQLMMKSAAQLDSLWQLLRPVLNTSPQRGRNLHSPARQRWGK
ncbi:MAG TPA: hypothetical protein VGR71_15385, partial [Nitrospira sp.]|nr:hypothetical protein [Nitrospira sp.]